MGNNIKHTKEFKLECIRKYFNGEYIETPPGMKRHSFYNKLSQWVRMYKSLGEKAFDGKRTFTLEQKLLMIERVIRGESFTKVSAENGVGNHATLKHWYEIYRNEGINGLKLLERSFSLFMKPQTKRKEIKKLTREELEERLMEAEAENEYLKKLDALVQKRKKQQIKKKQ